MEVDLTRYIHPEYDFLGEEPYGNVFKGRFKFIPPALKFLRPSNEIAIQVLAVPSQLKGTDVQTERWKQLQDVSNTWRKLDHVNIARVFGIAKIRFSQEVTDPDYPSIIQPFLQNCDVRTYIKSNPQASRLPILLGVANGMSYLHSLKPPVIHGTIAPENILIDGAGNPRLTQFGLASLMQDGTVWSTTATRPRTRVRYTAPELLKSPEVHYTMEADVYAYAMTSYEIVTGRVPFDEYCNAPALLAAIVFEKKRPKRRLYLNMDPKIWTLWNSCWSQEPGTRHSAAQVLERMNDVINNPTPSQPIILASGSHDGTIRLWNVVTGQLVKELPGLPKIDLESVAFSPNGKKLFVASATDDNRRVVHLDIATNVQEWTNNEGSNCAAYSGDLVASGSLTKEVHVFKAASGEKLPWVVLHNQPVCSIKFSPDGTLLASGSRDRTVKVVRVSDGTQLHLFDGHGGPAWCIAFSPNGKHLASGCRDKVIRIWTVSDWKSVAELKAEDTVQAIAFSADSKRLVSAGGKGGGVRLWDVETQQPLWTMTEHTSNIHGVAFSVDGSILASGSADKTVCVWDVESGESFYELKGHTMEVTSLAFSPTSVI